MSRSPELCFLNCIPSPSSCSSFISSTTSTSSICQSSFSKMTYYRSPITTNKRHKQRVIYYNMNASSPEEDGTRMPQTTASAPTPPTSSDETSIKNENSKKKIIFDPSKIVPDENPTYYFSDTESLVDPIYLDEVPGKIQLTEDELAEQKRRLTKYADELRKDRIKTERENARLFGWVKYAELMNGRFAMFFFVTGLLTEYWTDYTIPEQIDLLLRTLGVY